MSYAKSVLAKTAMALTIALGGAQMALAQDTYNYDNFQNAPPGSFLPGKKPAAQSKPAAKPAAKAPAARSQAKPAAKAAAPQTGVYNSGQMIPGNSFSYPAQNQLGQSDFIQPSGGNDQSTSGWVTPNTMGNQVDNSYPQPQTQTPFDGDVDLQQDFANQNNGGGSGALGTSGWVNPNSGDGGGGGNFSQPMSNQNSGISSSGWVNPGGGNNNISPQGGNQGLSSSGWVNPGGATTTISQPMQSQDSGVSSSGWITPGGGKGKGSSKPIKMAKPAQQMQPMQQMQPTQSQQWSQPQATNQAPLFGQVLEQEQGNSGGFQASGATAGANTGNMSAANPPDMPAGGFTVSPDAAVMPGMMNMLMNMQQQNGGGQRAAAPVQRQAGFTAPPMVRGVSNQVGRTVNRAVNRSVNQMLYKGLNSLRF